MEKNPRSTQVTGIHSPPVLLLAFVGTARILHGLPQRAHGSRARIVLTGMAGIVLTCMAGIVPTILLHFLHPDNCSCIVLPFDIPVGRLEVRCTNAAGAGMRRSGLQSCCISAITTIAPALFYLSTSLSVAWRSEGRGRFCRGELGRAPQAGCYFLDQLPQPAPGLFHALRPAESILRSPLPTWSPPTLGLAVSV